MTHGLDAGTRDQQGKSNMEGLSQHTNVSARQILALEFEGPMMSCNSDEKHVIGLTLPRHASDDTGSKGTIITGVQRGISKELPPPLHAKSRDARHQTLKNAIEIDDREPCGQSVKEIQGFQPEIKQTGLPDKLSCEGSIISLDLDEGSHVRLTLRDIHDKNFIIGVLMVFSSGRLKALLPNYKALPSLPSTCAKPK